MTPEPDAIAPSPARPSRRTLAQDALNIPNLLTMGRVVAIPFFVWLLDTPTPIRGFWACIVFTLAAITDLLDGWLARRSGLVTLIVCNHHTNTTWRAGIGRRYWRHVEDSRRTAAAMA